jgi:transcriptional regulator with XRE-family HTH domain
VTKFLAHREDFLMRSRKRSKPDRLAEKLQQIRQALGLSQTDLLVELGLADELPYQSISKNERGTREPTAIELLRYARLANVYVEVLLDDELELPAQLPSSTRHEGIPRQKTNLLRTPKS